MNVNSFGRTIRKGQIKALKFIRDNKLEYNSHYRERVRLKNGEYATLRLVRPQDKELFLTGFSKLSPETRFLRFHSGKTRLSPSELDYFTEVDGKKHLAIGARRKNAGLGVIRFVRLEKEPELAEVAIVVVDEYQHQGLGKALMERLIKAARERGVKRFQFHLVPDNQGMKDLVAHFWPVYDQAFDGETLMIQVPLGEEVSGD